MRIETAGNWRTNITPTRLEGTQCPPTHSDSEFSMHSKLRIEQIRLYLYLSFKAGEIRNTCAFRKPNIHSQSAVGLALNVIINIFIARGMNPEELPLLLHKTKILI